MIKVKKIISNTTFENFSDEYVIKYLSLENSSNTPKYWRTGDFDKSLVEFGINDKTGVIFKITIPILDFENIINENFYLPEKKAGMPICDIEVLKGQKNITDEMGSLTIFKGDNDLLITFNEETIQVVYCSGELGFGLNKENEIVSLVIYNYS